VERGGGAAAAARSGKVEEEEEKEEGRLFTAKSDEATAQRRRGESEVRHVPLDVGTD